MNAKNLVFQHGEKAVVAVVALVCVWSIYSTLGNEDIRASGNNGMSADQIKEGIAMIDDYRPRAQPPSLKPVPAYANRLASNLAAPLVADPVMGWMTAHPDLGPTIITEDYFYIYETQAPVLVAMDKVGSIGLKLAEPESVRNLDRVRDGGQVTWSRSAKKIIENHVDVIAAQIERKDGDVWKAVGGLIPVSQFADDVIVSDVKDYGTYTFRARLVMAGSFYGYGKESKGSVLALSQRALPLDAEDDRVFMVQIGKALAGEDADLKAKLIIPAPIADADLREGESVVVGPWSDPVSISVSSSIRFQLDKLSPDVDKTEATVLITELIRNDTEQAWLDVHKWTVEKNGVVGGDVLTPNPLTAAKLNEKFDLTTPFTLVKVERNVERTLYWEVKPITRADGKGKEFDLRAKTTRTDTATFKNQTNGEEITLVKMGRVTAPIGNRIIDPPIQNVDEETEFRRDPGEFKIIPLTVTAPIKHEPGTGPLEELHRKGNALAKTDTPYYELSDGRLYYWEPLNKTDRVLYKFGVEPPKPVVVAPVQPVPVAPDQAPGGRRSRDKAPKDGEMPPGMPPGMMPEDFMPPEAFLPPEGMDGATPPKDAPRRRR